MKKTILPALAMLIISAVMLSTASYAWFAMSSNVEANGMQVTVRSESAFLLIRPLQGDSEVTVESFQTDEYKNKTSASGSPFVAVDSIYPSAYFVEGDDLNSENNITSAADFRSSEFWYTANGVSATNGGISGSVMPLNTKDQTPDNGVDNGLDNYVMRYKYAVILAPGSEASEGLWVSALTITGADGKVLNPVRVIITTKADDVDADDYVEFDVNDVANFYSDVDISSGAGVSDDVVTYVYVYIYYDGNDATVYSNNFANLSNAIVTFNLSTEEPEAPAQD